MRKSYWAMIGVAAAAAVVAWSFLSSPKHRGPRLVLVIATCTVNKDYLGPYNQKVATTPFLTRFAQDALVFERHYTEAVQSGVAYASMFSGKQATGHGIFAHPEWLGDEHVLLSEVFAAGGYETHSWLGHGAASAAWNYAQGVDVLNQHLRILDDADVLNQHTRRLDGADADFRALLSELRANPEKRAFVLTNFTVTHSPYSRDGQSVIKFCERNPGAECESVYKAPGFWASAAVFWSKSTEFSYNTGRRMQAARALLGADAAKQLPQVIELLYRADVAKLDRIFEDIVRAVEEHGLLDDSLIVFTADHGEALHAAAPFRWAHSWQLTPEVVQVPLIVYGPGVGVPAGRYAGVTRSIDLLSTVAALAGLDPTLEHIDGRDLSAAIRGDVPPPELMAFSHTSLFLYLYWQQYKWYGEFSARFPSRDPELMWVSASSPDHFFRLHRIGEAGWQPEVFNLRADPFALHDIYDEQNAAYPDIFDELRRYHEDLVAAADAWGNREPSAGPGTQQEVLRSLGYIE